MFQLTNEEYKLLRSQFVIFSQKASSKYPPYAFTEQGIAMLSALLRSPIAVSVSIRIGVSATIYTQKITPKLQTDLNAHNAQYAAINVLPTVKVHDRFMIIDDIVYHIVASIKDLGKKIFAFSKMSVGPDELIKNI